MSPNLRRQFLGQPPTNLVQHQADQWFGAADVRWRDNEVEGRWPLALDEVGDSPITAACHLRDYRVSV
jgi:hypothetical protein